MKKNYFLLTASITLLFCASFFVVLISTTECSAQTPGEWTWMSGDSTINSTGSFGVQGTASATNKPPALYEGCEWTDHNGNLWLYGGQANGFVFYGDLWKYDPVISQWTWIKGTGAVNPAAVFGTQGVPSPTNTPGARGWAPASWVDNNNDLWMFGGLNNNIGGDMNDLWRYNIATNQWTWIRGSNTSGSAGNAGTMGLPSINNDPSCRHETPCAWVDTSGDFWLFGGYGFGQTDDMWRYNVASNMWTWMKGSPTTSVAASYGTIGVSTPTNTPGARNSYSRWADHSNNLWLFGGAIYGPGSFSDLWRFSVSTNEWTWMKGPNTPNSAGSFGTKCVEIPSNLPPARFENRNSWVDSCGNFWVFGGADQVGSYNVRNDLWRYSPSDTNWVWAGGSTTLNSPGLFGTRTLSSPFNMPPGRFGPLTWIDRNGYLWLFGGSRTGSATNMGNDLWRFVPDPSCGNGGTCVQALPVAAFTSSDTVFCTESGECIHFFDHSTGSPTSWYWSFPGAVPDTSNLQNPDSICYYNSGTYPVTLKVSNGVGSNTLIVSPHIIFAVPPQPPTVSRAGDTLYSSHAFGYQWYLNGFPIAAATDSFYIALQGGTYSVRITDSLGCYSQSGGVIILGISYLSGESNIKLYPDPANDWIIVEYPASASELNLEIFNTLGVNIYSHSLTEKYSLRIDTSKWPSGFYYYSFSDPVKRIAGKLSIAH